MIYYYKKLINENKIIFIKNRLNNGNQRINKRDKR